MSTNYFNEDKRTYISIRTSASCAHKLDYHIVLVTKYRKPVLVGRIAEDLKERLLSLCAEREWLPLALSIQPEHIHFIVGLKPVDAPDQVVHHLKGSTSYKILGAYPEVSKQLNGTKLWGRGYSIETLGRSNVAQIDAYLQTQDAHHSEEKIDRT